MLEWKPDPPREPRAPRPTAASKEQAVQTEPRKDAEQRIAPAPAVSDRKDEDVGREIHALQSETVTRRKPTVEDRVVAGVVWFLVGGFALALVTMTPAYIVGFDDARYHRFVYLSASIIGLIGAIYGRIPKWWRGM